MINKNQSLLHGGIINIEDYYSGDFSKYEQLFSDISNFYHGLKNKETLPTTTYKSRYNDLTKRFIKQDNNKDQVPERKSSATNLRAD